MKYILAISLSLMLVGCSDSPELSKAKSDLKEAKSDLEMTKSRLEYCEASNNMHNPVQENSEPTPPEPSTPQYEEVTYISVTLPGTNRDVTCKNSTYRECGLSLSECKDGYEYDCLQNVKSKTHVEQELIKEE